MRKQVRGKRGRCQAKLVECERLCGICTSFLRQLSKAAIVSMQVSRRSVVVIKEKTATQGGRRGADSSAMPERHPAARPRAPGCRQLRAVSVVLSAVQSDHDPHLRLECKHLGPHRHRQSTMARSVPARGLFERVDIGSAAREGEASATTSQCLDSVSVRLHSEAQSHVGRRCPAPDTGRHVKTIWRKVEE